MKPLRTRLQEARKTLGTPWEVLERDYLLSWILVGIAHNEVLSDALVFKGGTALKKCYFGDYRFSEDLDFSGSIDVPRGDALQEEIGMVCATAAEFLDEYAPVSIECERYVEREPHPGGQEAFSIRGHFPWQPKPMTRVMVEISMDEKVLKPTQVRKIIHGYGEPINHSLSVYALEEIIGEKLRAILQHVAKLESRGWSRSRARDYYDLWRILQAYRGELDLTGFTTFVEQKCAIRKMTFTGPDDFFPEPMMTHVKKTWDQWLGPLVPDLPDFDTVIGELRPQITAIVGAG